MTSRPGCLLLHGLTGTPANMDPVRHALEKSGFMTCAPLLAGHRSVEALNETTWQEWMETARNGFDHLVKNCDILHCCGLSLGSLLTLKLAAEVGPRLKSIALLGLPLRLHPFYEVGIVPFFRCTGLARLIGSVKKSYRKSVADPQGCESYRLNSLPRMPVRAVLQLQTFARVVESELSNVHQPILAIHARRDRIADIQSLEILKRGVAPAQIKITILPRSEHVITLDYEREFVATSVVDFFRQRH